MITKSESTIQSSYDVVIIGARIAGASTAMQLARAGLKVLLIDRSRQGKDILSTHALMRPAVLQLNKWGILERIRKLDTPTVKWTTFNYSRESVPIEIKEKNGIDGLYAPRRTVIDSILVDAAVESGATVRFGYRFKEAITTRESRITGAILEDKTGQACTVRCDVLIGADGLNSSVARSVGSEVQYQAREYTSTMYGYADNLINEGYQWHFNNRAASGAIPTNNNQHCVFVTLPSNRQLSLSNRDSRKIFIELYREAAGTDQIALKESNLSKRLVLFNGHPGFIRRNAGNGWALVGDAACFKDPLTAHGMTDALRDSELLARTVIKGGVGALSEYRDASRLFQAPIVEISESVASFRWSLDQLKELHIELSTHLKAEGKFVTSGEMPTPGNISENNTASHTLFHALCK